MSTLTDSGFAPVNGLQLYYEVHGSGGTPLLLLHGNLSTIEVDFGGLIPLLAADRQVIALEHQAHGRTADIDRPLRTEYWADDALALLDHLGVATADVLGYSSGSAVALHLALGHPDRVRKLVLVSAAYTLDGVHPGLMEGIGDLQPEMFEGTPFLESYRKVAPDSGGWANLLSKIQESEHHLPTWSEDTIRGIAPPVLLVIGDSDIVQPEHSVAFFRLLGGGVAGDMVGLPASRLAVLPGTTHISVVQRADWLASMTTDFLDAPSEPAPPGAEPS